MNIFLSDKAPKNSNIILSEGSEIISNPATCADIFNNFFSDAVGNLGIDRALHIDYMLNCDDPIDMAINTFKNHPSILRIFQEVYSENGFSFDFISESSIHSIISNIECQRDNIPPQILKENVDICTIVLSSDVNKCIYNGIFPNNLKHADIIPTFKRNERLHKINYRPISILPHFQRFMKNYYTTKFIITLIESFRNIYVVSERVIAPSIVCCSCWNL